MGEYEALAMVHIMIGFELNVLGTVGSGGDEAAEAMLIIAFLCYLTTAILIVLMKTGDLQGNQPAIISAIVLVLVAALFIIIGVAIWGDGTANRPYAVTLNVTGAAMGIIGGVFLILEMVGGGGGGKTGPSK